MAADFKKYMRLLAKLLPFGKAWEQIKEDPLLDGMAVELCRVEDRGKDLLREIDPRVSVELLDDWEQLLGIPDECTPANQSIEERQLQVTQKLSALGGLSKTYYEQIALQLGFDITVRNDIPFRVGRARVGDRLTNSERLRTVFRVGESRVGEQLRTFGWIFYWTAIIPVSEQSLFRVGSSRVGEPLVEFGNELVQCTLRKLKPAHTGIVFLFSD